MNPPTAPSPTRLSLPDSGVATGLNRLLFEARLDTVEPLRRTPAGVAVAHALLVHVSRQTEAGHEREVSVEIDAVAIGDLAPLLAGATPGAGVRVVGFLAAKSLRSRKPVLHLSEIEFLEGT